MPPNLSLFDADVMYLDGWGVKKIPRAPVRVEFGNGAVLTVFKRLPVGEEELITLSAESLSLRIWSEPVRFGESFVDGRFQNLESSSRFNFTRKRELSLLGLVEAAATGRGGEVVLGFNHLSVPELEAKLEATLPAWTAPLVEAVDERYRALRYLEPDEAERESARLDGLERRGLLPGEEIERLRAEVRRLGSRLPSAPVEPAGDRIDRLSTLADLRAAGALSEAEFEAEKARLLAE